MSLGLRRLSLVGRLVDQSFELKDLSTPALKLLSLPSMDAVLNDTVTITGFPADRLDHAREKLIQAHNKLVRAATKAGATVPSEPRLDILAERVQLYCPGCRTHHAPSHVDAATLNVAHDALCDADTVLAKQLAATATTSRPCPNQCCMSALMDTFLVLDLALTAERPRLAGWDFLFVVEPLVGGNLIRKVPGAQELPDTAPWRTKAITCDHCTTKRRRLETFVLKATGEDPAIPAGTLREVGRNCLEAFLGGLSPAALIARLTWAKLVRDAGDYDEESGSYGHRGPRVMNPELFMQYVAASIRVDGWLSRAAARERVGVRASADHALYLMFPPWRETERAQREWHEELARVAPGEADMARGAEVLAWAKALPEDGDEYTRNLRLMALQPYIQLDAKHYGLLASAINARERAIGRRVREEQANATHSNAYVGALGDRSEWEVVVERVADVDTDYGRLHIHTLRSSAGDTFIWKTTSKRMDVGWHGTVRGTVKRHSEYRGEKQTELSRCMVVEPKAVKAPKARKSKTNELAS